MTHHQTLLLNSDWVTFMSPVTINPTTLFTDPDLNQPAHDCQQILAEDQGWQKDWSVDQPLPDAEATWFTGGSSLVEGQCKVGAAIVERCRWSWQNHILWGCQPRRQS